MLRRQVIESNNVVMKSGIIGNFRCNEELVLSNTFVDSFVEVSTSCW